MNIYDQIERLKLAFEAAEKHGWIPIAERQPVKPDDEDLHILVYTRQFGATEVEFHDGEFWQHDGSRLKDVVAWQLMPPAPLYLSVLDELSEDLETFISILEGKP
tara:strand:- start:66 stop:380 length:315 start_codon:yes stop_codon:yes gene_type:complete